MWLPCRAAGGVSQSSLVVAIVVIGLNEQHRMASDNWRPNCLEVPSLDTAKTL